MEANSKCCGCDFGFEVMTSAAFDRTVELMPSALAVYSQRGGVELIDKMADEWRVLCSECADHQPFYRPEWIRAYLRAFAPKAKLRLIIARSNGKLQLVLPLVEETGTFNKVPIRKLRAPVNKYAGRFDCVYGARTDKNVASQVVWRFLRQSSGWDVLQFRDALYGSMVSGLAAAAKKDGFGTIEYEDNPTPIVLVSSDPQLRKQLPVNARLRRELRSIRRHLTERGTTLKLRRLQNADPEALEKFYQLEASGWKGREHSAILFENVRSFFDEIAEAAARFGYFTLYLLELNGKIVAGHFGLTVSDRYYSLIVAYDEDYREYSPGHLLIDEIIDDCAARGIVTYHTMGQNQEWKMKWAQETQPVSHHFIFRGALGNLAHLVASRFRNFKRHSR